MLEATFSIDIKAEPGRVWAEIFRKGGPHHPMFGTYLHGEITAGSVLSYRDKTGKHTFVIGQVIEVLAPKRLTHTFRFSMEQDAPTLVEWTLEPTAEGTRVMIRHSRFEGETKTYRAVSTSWIKILKLYKAVIETGKAPVGARLSNGMMMAMSFMLPKSARTETAMAGKNTPPGM